MNIDELISFIIKNNNPAGLVCDKIFSAMQRRGYIVDEVNQEIHFTGERSLKRFTGSHKRAILLGYTHISEGVYFKM